MRELITGAGLPQPDEVEYGETCIWLVWHDHKLVVSVDQIPMDDRDRADESESSDWDGGPKDQPPV
jgi:hypothetical protein